MKRNKYLDNRGSSTIFLLMVLSSMILVTTAYVQATLRVLGDSAGQSVALLSARSVLTEFDRNLKNEYGLFAFRGEPAELSSKMDFYSAPYFQSSPYFELHETRVDVTNYRLCQPLVLEKAIVEYMIFASGKKLLDFAIKKETKDADENGASTSERRMRVLRNRKIIESLPSYGLDLEASLIDGVKAGLSDWDQVFQNTSKGFLVNQFIMMNFKNAYTDIPGKSTFFECEAEYILKGGFDDQQNRRSFRNDLLILRNAVNLATIYLSPQMRQQVIAAAAIVSPGPASLITQLLIAEAWALAEAENDVRNLEHGKKIPLQKTAATWAVDIQSIIKNKEAGYIENHGKTGLDYACYLQIFLFFEDKNTKMTRVMDLIQINIQGNYDKTFLIEEHQTGLNYECDINYFEIRGATEY